MRRLVLLTVLAVSAAAGPLTDGRRTDEAWRAAGGAAVKKSVAAALSWLARHQHRDGYWDADEFGKAAGHETVGPGGGWHGEPVPCRFDREVTALAVLAFLGAGHTHKHEGPYRTRVERAIEWLRDGRARTLFGTAYVTQALAEAYDMTGDKSLREPVESRVETMLDCRHPKAGWRYFARSRMASGVPTTAAVVSALAAARRSGFKVSRKYERTLLAWLDGLMDKKTGKVKYHVGSERLGYTPTTTNAASTLLMRAWLEQHDDPRFASALKPALKRKPKWSIRFKEMVVNGRKRRVQIGFLQHYYWWHTSDALALAQHKSRGSWQGALRRALLPKQHKDGPLKGSWDPAGTYGKVGGRVFSTALCALALSAPARYRSSGR